MSETTNNNKLHTFIKYLFLILSLALSVFIIVQSCLTGSESTNSSNFLVEFFKTILNTFSDNFINDDNIDRLSFFVRKMFGHYGLFLIDSIFISTYLLFAYHQSDKSKVYVLLLSLTLGFGLAILTELIQTFVPGRSGTMNDSMIDFLGYSTGVILTYFFIPKGYNHQSS